VRKHSEIRDPRFDERTGSFNEGLFKKSYAFLDEMKQSEKQLVQREAKKARNPEKRAKLQTLIQQMVGTCVHTIPFIMCFEEQRERKLPREGAIPRLVTIFDCFLRNWDSYWGIHSFSIWHTGVP